MDLLDKKIISQYGSKAAYCDSVNISPQSFKNRMSTYKNKMEWVGKFLKGFGIEVKLCEITHIKPIDNKYNMVIIYNNIYRDMVVFNKDKIHISLKDMIMNYGNGMKWRVSFVKFNIIDDLKIPYVYGRYSTWDGDMCDKKGCFFSIKKSDLETIINSK